jgi:hypothetical protein
MSARMCRCALVSGGALRAALALKPESRSMFQRRSGGVSPLNRRDHDSDVARRGRGGRMFDFRRNDRHHCAHRESRRAVRIARAEPPGIVPPVRTTRVWRGNTFTGRWFPEPDANAGPRNDESDGGARRFSDGPIAKARHAAAKARPATLLHRRALTVRNWVQPASAE